MSHANGNPPTSTRRSFLCHSAALSAAAIAAPEALAKPVRTTKVTVVLFQRGGADALNLYPPTGDPNYAALRPLIAVPPPGTAGGGLALNATFSLHPAMPGLHSRYTATNSRLAVVHAVGYQPPNRSHFASQDLYETGMVSTGPQVGWINRHLQATSGPNDALVRAMAVGTALPVALTGAYPCYAVTSTADLGYGGGAALRLYQEGIAVSTNTAAMLPAAQLAYQCQRDAFDLIDHFAMLQPGTYTPSNGAVYPTGTLGTSLKQVAEAIKANRGIEFFTVDQGGWDHHQSIVARLTPLATTLNDAIHAFFTDLGGLAADVLLVAMSEFGREVRVNGSLGTDHGMGGAMLVVGGACNGGQVYGNWPTLAPSALHTGRFLNPVNDFRNVLGEVLDRHMGGTNMGQVFPGHVYQPLGLL